MIILKYQSINTYKYLYVYNSNISDILYKINKKVSKGQFCAKLSIYKFIFVSVHITSNLSIIKFLLIHFLPNLSLFILRHQTFINHLLRYLSINLYIYRNLYCIKPSIKTYNIYNVSIHLSIYHLIYIYKPITYLSIY